MPIKHRNVFQRAHGRLALTMQVGTVPSTGGGEECFSILASHCVRGVFPYAFGLSLVPPLPPFYFTFNLVGLSFKKKVWYGAVQVLFEYFKLKLKSDQN